MPTDTPSLLAAIDAAAALGKAATKRPWSVMTDPPDTVRNLIYIVASANLDHAAIAKELRDKDAEIKRYRKVLEQFAICELNSDNCASLKVATNRIRSIARSALAPAVGDDHAQ